MRTPPSRVYNTRQTQHISFKHNEMNVNFQDVDGSISPCFFMSVKDRGLVKKATIILRSCELCSYIGTNYKEKSLFY